MRKEILVGTVLMLLSACSKPASETARVPEIPEANNVVTRYAHDLQTAPGRAQAAVEKINAATARTHQAVVDGDPNNP